MRKILFVLILVSMVKSLISQPSEFTWTSRHNGINYISNAKDQKEQGSCKIFAPVAAVEAMTQIYFNKGKNSLELDLSESYIHSKCGPTGGCREGTASVTESLDWIKSNGIVDEATLPFPIYPTNFGPCCYYRDTCDIQNPSLTIKIPGYDTLNFSSDIKLKKAIMDRGPLIAVMNNDFGCLYNNTSCPSPCIFSCSGSHVVLIVGWKPGKINTQWQVKDSWACNPSLYYHEFNMVDYSPVFYYIKPETPGTVLSCTGNGCTGFTSRTICDNDGDGFYNWGIGPKPSSLTNAPIQMDYNDANPAIISLDTN